LKIFNLGPRQRYKSSNCKRLLKQHHKWGRSRSSNE